MVKRAPSDVGGYVLAGGKSSRMGQDKALLKLAGKSLVLLAVEKLRQVCADVYVLGNRSELDVFGPLIRDLNPDCGPLGGFEAAQEHSRHDWNLFVPVDMPFLPAGFLDRWVRIVVEQRIARVAIFTVDGRPQPAVCMLHKDTAPYVRTAVAKGEFKLLSVLEMAAKDLAARQRKDEREVLLNLPWDGETAIFRDDGPRWTPTKKQWEARHLWFANLNTPEEFAAAEALTGVLERD